MMEKAKRPRITDSVTVKIATGCGSAYVTVTYVNGKPFDCFMHLGKAGACAIAQGEALLRSVSIGLRYGIPIKEYVDQFEGISCPSRAWDNGKAVMSCADAISKVLREVGVGPVDFSNEEGEPECLGIEESEHSRRVTELREARDAIG